MCFLKMQSFTDMVKYIKSLFLNRNKAMVNETCGRKGKLREASLHHCDFDFVRSLLYSRM